MPVIDGDVGVFDDARVAFRSDGRFRPFDERGEPDHVLAPGFAVEIRVKFVADAQQPWTVIHCGLDGLVREVLGANGLAVRLHETHGVGPIQLYHVAALPRALEYEVSRKENRSRFGFVQTHADIAGPRGLADADGPGGIRRFVDRHAEGRRLRVRGAGAGQHEGGVAVGPRALKKQVDSRGGVVLGYDAVLDVRQCAMPVHGAAPPRAPGPLRGDIAGIAKAPVAEITGLELARVEDVQHAALGEFEVFRFAGGLPELEAQAQEIGFRTALVAVVLHTEIFQHPAVDQEVGRGDELVVEFFGGGQDCRVAGRLIQHQVPAQGGQVPVAVLDAARFEQGHDPFRRIEVAVVFCCPPEHVEPLDELREADESPRGLTLEPFRHIGLGTCFVDAEQKIAQLPGALEGLRRARVLVVFH